MKTHFVIKNKFYPLPLVGQGIYKGKVRNKC